jgi:pimeloyl-ACP methyl ester carboxylesterase
MTPVRAYFEVPAADGTPPHDFYRLPFPNDIRRDPMTGHINLTGFPHPGTGPVGFDIVDRYRQAIEQEINGFGTNQEVFFRFSASVDFNTLTLGNSVQVIDLTSGQPPGSTSFSANTAGNRYVCPNILEVSTGVGAPMQPNHTYAVFLTNGIHDTMGHAITRDADFAPMLMPDAPADTRLTAAYAAYAPLRSYLTAHMIDPSTIVDAAVFTTQDPTRVASALRDAVRAQPAPVAHNFVRCDTGVMSPCDDGLTGADHVRGCFAADPAFDELQGQIDVPIVQQGMRPYSNPGDGMIQTDAMGHVMAQGTERVCVTVTIPHGVAMPMGGWPVVLYAHGTGGNYRSGVTEGLAASFASIDTGGGATAHFAMLGYDGVMHGPRRGMGVTDSPNVLFFNFTNPEAARDNVLQGTADVFALVRALQSVQLPMLPTATQTVAFDPMRVLFVGHSQGSTVGTAAVALEPGIRGAVLSGAGGDLRVSLTTKRHPVDIASLLPIGLQELSVDAGHPVLQLFQMYFERSDAVNYGPMILYNQPMGVPLRPIVQTYGLGDTYSSNGTMRALASSIGLQAALPIPGGTDAWPSMGVTLPVMNNVATSNGMTTAILLESDPMGAYDGHFVLFNDPTLKARVMNFLASVAAGMPSVH